MKLNDKIKNSNPFSVPDGYFDTLTDRMMSAVKENDREEEAKEEQSVPVRRISLRPFLALAAAILGFAIMTVVVIRLASENRGTSDFNSGISMYSELEAEEIDAYIIENELAGTEPVDLTEDESISSDAIIDYLMAEGVEISEIYELL